MKFGIDCQAVSEEKMFEIVDDDDINFRSRFPKRLHMKFCH